MRKLSLVLLTLSLIGCGSQYNTVKKHQQTARIDSIEVNKEHQATSKLEEYVNRVNKRLQVVSERPSSKYFFAVVDSKELALSYDPDTRTILISRGLLTQLHDEAELAATLSLSIAKFSGETNPDRETVSNLYRAGYDPKAMLELQEQYFHAAHAGQDHWLKVIYNMPPTAGTITANKLMISNMEEGLQRDSDDYHKQVGG